jgi:hypothetical protein
MRNITIQLTDEVYHHARVAAAARNMSVSALFRNFILTLEKEPTPNRPDHRKFLDMFPALPDDYLADIEERADRKAHKYHHEHRAAF